MKSKHLKTIALAAAALAVSAGSAAAAPSGTPSPEGDANLIGVSWWPGNGAEHSLWVDDEGDRMWGLPGDFGYIRFPKSLLNGPGPCPWIPNPNTGGDGGSGGSYGDCDTGGWTPVYDHQVPPVETSRIELENGTVVGTLVPYNQVWKLTAPETPYNGKIYATYLDSDDEDGDGNTTERLHREIGPLVTKNVRPQPALTSPTQNFDITAIVDVSSSMSWNDPDFKRRDAADLLFKTAESGDRIGVNKFSNFASELLPVTTINSDDHAKTLSAQVRPLIDNEAGTDYSAGINQGFTQLYQDALDQNSLSSRRKLVIFLTDGKQEHRGNWGWKQFRNDHIRFTHSPGQYSWPVCTIQLGNSFSSRDVNRLKRIASSTGGTYVRATTDAALVDAFKQCRGVTACEYTLQRRSWGSVTTGQQMTTTTRLPARHKLATFLVTGDNLRHDVKLVGPSGNKYSATNLPAGFKYKTGRSWGMFEVTNPSSGDWKVEITANGVEQGEEDRVISRTTVDRCDQTTSYPAID